MAEVTLRSYNPLAYFVNNVSDLDLEIVKAHRNNDTQKTRELLSRVKNDFDIFICVDNNHAFVLCVPCGPIDGDEPLSDALSKNPSDIPELQLCWSFELCFENVQFRMYKIRKVFSPFKDIKRRINRSWYVGTYKDSSPTALQFAVLRAAPHHYSVLLNDCVEFSKEFCVALLSYCSNGNELEKQVLSRIKEASATGFSAEKLSRNSRASGLFGNFALNGVDVSSMMAENKMLVLFLLLVYPIITALVIGLILKYIL